MIGAVEGRRHDTTLLFMSHIIPLLRSGPVRGRLDYDDPAYGRSTRRPRCHLVVQTSRSDPSRACTAIRHGSRSVRSISQTRSGKVCGCVCVCVCVEVWTQNHCRIGIGERPLTGRCNVQLDRWAPTPAPADADDVAAMQATCIGRLPSVSGRRHCLYLCPAGHGRHRVLVVGAANKPAGYSERSHSVETYLQIRAAER